MKRVLFLLLIGSIAFVGCNKNHKAIRKISDGEWKVTTFKDDGKAVFEDFDSWSGTATFDKCRQTFKGSCSAEMNLTATRSYSASGADVVIKYDDSMSLEYKTMEKGSEIEITILTWEYNFLVTADGVEVSDDEDTGACDSECTFTGTINDDYTEITATGQDGGEIVLTKI